MLANLACAILTASILLFAGCTHKSSTPSESIIPKISSFPVGEENTGFAKYFIGKSYLAPLTTNKDLNAPLHNVTFEPGSRNNWHSHSGGQILIAVGGSVITKSVVKKRAVSNRATLSRSLRTQSIGMAQRPTVGFRILLSRAIPK